MSKNNNKNTQNVEVTPVPTPTNAHLLDFDAAQLKSFDEVHVTIAELIKEDLLILLEKHLPQILSARGYDLEGREVRGGRSRTQQTILGLLKGPFSVLFEGQKKRSASAALSAERKKVAELEAMVAELLAAKNK
tara:strand:- start:1697 stop:2098 length:402 start_codon:yes stop_codon:yes gene_type:complete